MPEKRPAIGQLRWPFQLVKRTQAVSGTSGITETVTDQATIWGKIENTYATTYWGINGAQSERPITHMIWVRWRPYLDNTYALQRLRTLPDGTQVTEIYRIRRVCEIDQKTWIVRLECEQETVE
ncbi:MAG: head-tail adaptor protein [Betaproteobacteria bacterium]|nr:head-tail adaptor protein [Betaproteobacteria bacterium]